MSQEVSMEFDMRRLNERLAQQYDALVGKGRGADAANVVKDQGKLLIKQVMKFTPPKNQPQGKAAVTRDINRAVEVLKPLTFTHPVFQKYAIEAYQSRDPSKLLEVWKRMKTFVGWRFESFDAVKLHKSQRDRRGRIQREKKVFTLDAVAHGAYLKKIIARVGLMKASWAPAFAALGGKVQPWVKKHQRQHGWVIPQLDGTKPTVTINSHARGIGDFRGQFQSALRARAQAMVKATRGILSNYSAQWRAGVRIRRSAKATPGSENPF